ncbi:MAG: sigma-70 family RNA polymerase sigma factor [Chlorobi bacterium]|nr:sigma-70 family RNA polymerase sigma factor [Chlorobiota bacterium]
MTVPKKIIRQCKQNKKKAQAYLFKKYAPEFLGICMRYMKDKTKAEDAVQDAFVTIFSKISQFKGTGSFEGWMRRITLNTALTQLRKNKKEIISEKFDLLEEDSGKEIKKDLNPSDIQSVIEHAKFDQFEIIEIMNELPDGFRTVFNLYVIEGLMHKEIAEKLGINIGTSKSQLQRARTKLKELLYNKALIKLRKPKKERNGR